MDGLLDVAADQLERVKVVARQTGLKYVDLAPAPFGVGIGIAWSETEYVVLSVLGGNESQLMITSGVLKDVAQNRLAVLDACNRRTRDCTAYPFYLHDAPIGWDILVQQTFPIELMLEVRAFFVGAVTNLPQVAQFARNDFAANEVFGGQPYRWSDGDIQRLLMCSML